MVCSLFRTEFLGRTQLYIVLIFFKDTFGYVFFGTGSVSDLGGAIGPEIGFVIHLVVIGLLWHAVTCVCVSGADDAAPGRSRDGC